MTNKVPHNKHTSKYGTDDRYPYWKGGAIDPKMINGYTAIAIILNWTAVILAVRFLINPDSENAGLWFQMFNGIAIAVCLDRFFFTRKHLTDFSRLLAKYAFRSGLVDHKKSIMKSGECENSAFGEP